MLKSKPPVDLPKVIPEEVMLAVLNRCDETREFMVQMWLDNPHLAKQGGAKVAMLLGQPFDNTEILEKSFFKTRND